MTFLVTPLICKFRIDSVLNGAMTIVVSPKNGAVSTANGKVYLVLYILK